jgi:Fic family protein
MDRSEFSDASPGRLEPTAFSEEILREGRKETVLTKGLGFVPDPLPPRLDLGEILSALYNEFIAAERALSEIEGAAKLLPNPHLLMGPLWRREAQLSSKIENTIAPARDVALFDLEPEVVERRDDALEITNYIRALRYGLDSPLPICLRLIREMHEVLMHDVPRMRGRAGVFRREQNAIAPEKTPFARATFVPPPPAFLDECLGNLEQYINNENDTLPRLVRIALVHYQFETIHPFEDGNGRLGRLLIGLQLCRDGQLSKPLVYVSGYFERHRSEYYRLLKAVSTHGVWLDWFRFFFDAVSSQAQDALIRAGSLNSLRMRYHDLVREKRASANLPALVDMLFQRPAVRVSDVAARFDVTAGSAGKLVDRLVDRGILVEATGRLSHRIYVAPAILHIIEADDPAESGADDAQRIAKNLGE